MGVPVSALREYVKSAERDPAVAVGAPVFSPSPRVRSSVLGRLSGAMPVMVGADLAVVPLIPHHCVVRRFDILDGVNRAPIGERSHEGDLDDRP